MGTKILINLLPPEIIAKEFKKAKFYKIQAIGVFVILVMVFLASLTIALRILQSRNITTAQAQLTQIEQKVTSLNGIEANLFLLKNRLATIEKYLGVSSEQSSLYQQLIKLMPLQVEINALSIDQGGEAVFTAVVPDSSLLDDLIYNLSSKVQLISIENLNRDKDGIFRVNVKIQTEK